MSAEIGVVITELMKAPVQGAQIEVSAGIKVFPTYKCCLSGTDTGVVKLPVPHAACFPQQVFVGDNARVSFNAYSPIGNTFLDGDVWWGDGATTDLNPVGGQIQQTVNHAYAAADLYKVQAQVLDDGGYYGMEEFSVDVIAASYAHGIALLAATDSGIWRSVDGGQNWTQVLDLPFALDLKIDPHTLSSSESRVLAAVYGYGLYESLDSGRTWRQAVNTTGIFAVAFYPTRQDAYAYLRRSAANAYQVLYTTDDGDTWTTVTFSGAAYSANETRIKTVLKTSSALAVSYDDRYIYAYTEGPVLSAYVERIDTYASTHSTIVTLSKGNGLSIKTAPRSIVYVGDGVNGVYDIVYSEDFGTTWTDLTSVGFTNLDVRDIVISAKDVKHVSLLQDNSGTMYTMTSQDGGGSWQGSYDGTMVSALCVVSLRKDPQFYFIGTDAGVYEGPGSGYYQHEVSGGSFTELVHALGVFG